MATVILVRHGRTTANASGILAGRTPGIELDERGREQALAATERIADLPLAAVVSSPLERCRQTAGLVAPSFAETMTIEDDLAECDYGDWQGRPLKELAEEPLWKVVQQHPSAVEFPGGESMAWMQARSVAAIRRHDRAIEAEHGPGAVWLAVSHGDIIKSILADALGQHLDLFQRLGVHPASMSVVRFGEARPQVIAVNTEAGSLAWLRAAPPSADAPVGGGDHPAVS